jgi:hypothetical protein
VQEDVGARDQARQHIGRLRTLEIERERFLRPVDPDEVTGLTLDRTVVTAGKVTDARSLDLDDTCTEIGELPAGKRRRNCLLDRDDEQALKRQTCLAVPRLCSGRRSH